MVHRGCTMIAKPKTGRTFVEPPVTGYLPAQRVEGSQRGITALLLLALLAGGAAAPAARSNNRNHDMVEEGFRTMMNDAVTRMHADMHVPYTGDADRDFARMMIPHHQGAIDMALVELRYGKDPRLKRLAQEIIVTQQQEIAVMHLALGDPLPPGTPAPTQLNPNGEVHHDR